MYVDVNSKLTNEGRNRSCNTQHVAELFNFRET